MAPTEAVSRDRWSLTKDADELAQLVRILGASVNVAILRELAKARRRGDGWMYLSQIAEAIDEAPGTVGIAIQKLTPLLDEKREKGLRYFRARLVELAIEVERPPRDQDRPTRVTIDL